MSILYESLGESIEDTLEITIDVPTPEPKINWKTAAILIVPGALLLYLAKMPKKV